MTDNVIQLKKDEDLVRFVIKDAEGKDTGNYLEFNLLDIELPLRLQELMENDKKVRTYFANQLKIIEKKQDHKGKKLLSANEEARMKAIQDFYKKEVEIYNMFLGEHGVEKLLNGGKLSFNTFKQIDDIIATIILPKLKITGEDIKAKIMQKYSNTEDKRDDVIE